MRNLLVITLAISSITTSAHAELIQAVNATSSSVKANGEAYKAIDGESNNGTYVNDAVSGVCAHTRPTASWITVDLGDTYTIDSMDFVGRGDCCSAQSSNWDIYVGDTGSDSDDTLCTSDADVSGGDVITVTCDSVLAGRYVTVTSDTAMVLCEIEVYGEIEVDEDTTESVAYAIPTTQGYCHDSDGNNDLCVCGNPIYFDEIEFNVETTCRDHCDSDDNCKGYDYTETYDECELQTVTDCDTFGTSTVKYCKNWDEGDGGNTGSITNYNDNGDGDWWMDWSGCYIKSGSCSADAECSSGLCSDGICTAA